jgi:hypothetical protein
MATQASEVGELRSKNNHPVEILYRSGDKGQYLTLILAPNGSMAVEKSRVKSLPTGVVFVKTKA